MQTGWNGNKNRVSAGKAMRPASSGRNRMAYDFPTLDAAERGVDGAARHPCQGQFQAAPHPGLDRGFKL